MFGKDKQVTVRADGAKVDPRPVWDWTNDLKVTTTLHLEPSFKEELGVVFLQLKQGDQDLGIWLPGSIVESLRDGLDKIAEYAQDDSWDTDDSVVR